MQKKKKNLVWKKKNLMIKKKKKIFVKKELKSQKNAKECYICGNEIQKILKI